MNVTDRLVPLSDSSALLAYRISDWCVMGLNVSSCVARRFVGPGTDHHVSLLSLVIFLLLSFFLLVGNLFKKAQCSVVSNRIWMKFGKIILQINAHRFFRCDVIYTFKMGATTSFLWSRTGPYMLSFNELKLRIVWLILYVILWIANHDYDNDGDVKKITVS